MSATMAMVRVFMRSSSRLRGVWLPSTRVIYVSKASGPRFGAADGRRNARVRTFPPCSEPSLTNRVTWALTGLVVLAVLLPVGLRNSDAAFVAGSTNNGSLFSSASSFNTVFTSADRSGHAAARQRDAQRRRDLRPRHGHRRVPDLAGRREHVDDRAAPTTRPPIAATSTRPPLTDGLYDVRALATDSAGYTNTSTVANRRVDNTGADRHHHERRLAADRHRLGRRAPAPTAARASPPRRSSTARAAAAAGPTSAPRRARAPPARGTPRRSPTASTTCARSPPTSPATPAPRAVVTNRRLDNIAPSATMTDARSPPAGSGDAGLDERRRRQRHRRRLGPLRVQAQLRLELEHRVHERDARRSRARSTPRPPTDGLYDFRAVAIDGVGKERRLGRRHLAPDRQHRPDGDDGRAGRQPLRLGVAHLDRSPTAAPASPRPSTSTSSPPARRGPTPARPRRRRTPARSTPPR